MSLCYTAHVSDTPIATVTINGEAQPLASQLSMLALLEARGYTTGRVAVELNGDILPRSQYASYIIQAGDRIEIVHFVGGG